MFSVDDMRSIDDWGHFAPLVVTPNIDRLAAMGTTFERAITQVPLCNASRASLFTGQQPSQTGVLDNGLLWYERVDAADTLPAVLRQPAPMSRCTARTSTTTRSTPARGRSCSTTSCYAPFDGDPAKVAHDGVYQRHPFKSGRYTDGHRPSRRAHRRRRRRLPATGRAPRRTLLPRRRDHQAAPQLVGADGVLRSLRSGARSAQLCEESLGTARSSRGTASTSMCRR